MASCVHGGFEAIDTDSGNTSRESTEYVFYSGNSRCIDYLSALKGHLTEGIQTLKEVLRTLVWILEG